MMPILKNKPLRPKDENRFYRRRRRTVRRFLLPERRSRSKQAGIRGSIEVMVIALASEMSRAIRKF